MFDPRAMTDLPVTVIGAARSGIAAARLLRAAGARVLVSESGPRADFAATADALAAEGIDAEFGGHTARVADAALVVVSPGVPSDAAVLAGADRDGVPVVSELEVGWRFANLPTVGVTGTNGKTTTTALCGALLAAAGFVPVVGGNIGTAACDAVRTAPADANVLVLEVSSYQLDRCDAFRPDVAVLTNVTPDHLARYGGDFDRYVDAKRRIARRQTAADAFVFNREDPSCAAVARDVRSRLLPAALAHAAGDAAWLDGDALVLDAGSGPERFAALGDLRIPGMHNAMNVLMAALAARTLGASAAAIGDGARAFPGVEHRLERVRTRAGVEWINDSKATNVDSLVVALRSMTRPVVLIAGGRDKGAPYDPLDALVRERVRVALLIGEAAERMAAAFAGWTEVRMAGTLEFAVAAAADVARPGETVLLSPACASFDQFTDFEDRGRVFKDLVARLDAGAEAA